MSNTSISNTDNTSSTPAEQRPRTNRPWLKWLIIAMCAALIAGIAVGVFLGRRLQGTPVLTTSSDPTPNGAEAVTTDQPDTAATEDTDPSGDPHLEMIDQLLTALLTNDFDKTLTFFPEEQVDYVIDNFITTDPSGAGLDRERLLQMTRDYKSKPFRFGHPTVEYTVTSVEDVSASYAADHQWLESFLDVSKITNAVRYKTSGITCIYFDRFDSHTEFPEFSVYEYEGRWYCNPDFMRFTESSFSSAVRSSTASYEETTTSGVITEIGDGYILLDHTILPTASAVDLKVGEMVIATVYKGNGAELRAKDNLEERFTVRTLVSYDPPSITRPTPTPPVSPTTSIPTSDFSPNPDEKYVVYVYVTYVNENGFLGGGDFKDHVYVEYPGASDVFHEFNTVRVEFYGRDYTVETREFNETEGIFYGLHRSAQTIRNPLSARLSDWKTGEPLYDKPIIYFYPEADTVIDVRLDLDGDLTCSYPLYGEDGWNGFTAHPDGTLEGPDGREYYALYWEGRVNAGFDMSRGFCVEGSRTAEFLEKILPRLGLTAREAEEFIVYWLPQMQGSAYNLITFQTDAYTDSALLTVDPEPDTLIRVFMVWQELDQPVEIPPQEIATPERIGFTVVEWGGSEIRTGR